MKILQALVRYILATLFMGICYLSVSVPYVPNAQASLPGQCHSAQLTTRIGQANGAAGTIFYPLVFTNTGPACTIYGVPSVQPVSGSLSHRPLGPTAKNLSMGQMPVRFTVAKGASVSSTFGVSESGNYTPTLCAPANASGIVVTLPGFVSNRYVALPISVCTKLASTSTRLLVRGTQGY